MIRTVNDVLPGVKRPFRLQDIEFVWEGLNSALAASVGSTPRILSGFNIKADNNLSAGVIAFNGQLYMHPDTDGYRIPLDATVYAGSAPSADDMRAFADGTVQNMYWYDVLSTNETIAEGVEGVLVGAFTKANIEVWSAFGGGGGNTKVFSVPVYGYLARKNPEIISLDLSTVEEIVDAFNSGKQVVFMDTTWGQPAYFLSANFYEKTDTDYKFTVKGCISTPSRSIGIDRSRCLSLNISTGVLNVVSDYLVNMNIVPSDANVTNQNVVTPYDTPFNFQQNVLIKDVGSVVTGNWGSGKRYDVGINANTDVELNFFNPLYVASVKVATVNGTDKINVSNPLVSGQHCALNNNGLDLFSPATSTNGGLSYLNSAGNAFLGFIGARVTGDTLNKLFLGWGSDPANTANQFYVSETDIKYKNVNVALTDDSKPITVHRTDGSNARTTYHGSGISITPISSNNSTGLAWKKQDESINLLQVGAFTNGDDPLNYMYMGWGSSPSNPSNNLSVGADRLTYKNIPVALTDDSKPITVHRTDGSNVRTIHHGSGLDIIPDRLHHVTGVTWRNQANTANLLQVGAATNGDSTSTYMFMGWGPSPVNLSNNLAVGADRLTYKDNPILTGTLTGTYYNVGNGGTTNVKYNFINDLTVGGSLVATMQKVYIATIRDLLNNSAGLEINFANAAQCVTYLDADYAIWVNDPNTNRKTSARLVRGIQPGEDTVKLFLIYMTPGANRYQEVELDTTNNKLRSVNNARYYQAADNTVGTAAIADRAVTSDKLADSAITNAKLGTNSVNARVLSTDSVDTRTILNGAVTVAKLADNSVGTSKIQNGAVTNLKLANNAVDSLQIADRAVITAKIRDAAVTKDKLATNSVWTAQLSDGAVTIDKLAVAVKPHIILAFTQNQIGGAAQSGINIQINPYNITVGNPTWNSSWSAYVWTLNKNFPYGFVPLIAVAPSGRSDTLAYLYYINYDNTGVVIELRTTSGALLTSEPRGDINVSVTLLVDDRTVNMWTK